MPPSCSCVGLKHRQASRRLAGDLQQTRRHSRRQGEDIPSFLHQLRPRRGWVPPEHLRQASGTSGNLRMDPRFRRQPSEGPQSSPQDFRPALHRPSSISGREDRGEREVH